MDRTFRAGDKIRHAGKPEWGEGLVISAKGDTQDGKPCQRLDVRFDRAGPKMISTAFAPLVMSSEVATLAPEREPNDPLRAEVDRPSAEEMLLAVPERASDPFLSGRKRLENTLDLYKFTEAGASLLDWAAMQTGLKDPLARFNRHELEQYFQRFKANLDAHLKKLVKDLKRQEPGLVAEMSGTVSQTARSALRRADA